MIRITSTTKKWSTKHYISSKRLSNTKLVLKTGKEHLYDTKLVLKTGKEQLYSFVGTFQQHLYVDFNKFDIRGSEK
jgi:hypothetical protein